MHSNLNRLARMPSFLVVYLICLTPLGGFAAEIFVAAGDAKADDKNPGTEALPFKTIQPAVDIAKPGDTVYVKAGIYSDPVAITRGGKGNGRIVLSAWKDDRVTLGCVPHALPAAEQWQPVPGSKSFRTVLPEQTPDDMLLLVDDKAVITLYKAVPPKDDQAGWGAYDKATRTLMFNANGKNPAQAAKMQYIRRGETLRLDFSDFWTIRKLEFRYATTALYLNADSCIVEDCFFHNIARPAIFLPGGRCDTIRRCNFYRNGNAIVGNNGVAQLIEDNLMVECGQNGEEDVAYREGVDSEGAGPTCFKGPSLGMIFRYNTIAEGHGGAGWYADIGSKSARVIGNAFWNIPTGAIYNELAVDDTLITGNYFLESGLSSSWCSRLNIVDNFFDQTGVTWHNRIQWPLRASFMTLRGNAFVNPGGGYLTHNGWAWAKTPYPEGFTNCLVDYNQVRLKEGSVLLADNGSVRTFKTIEEVRKTFGWELHGEVKPYDPKNNDLTPESMGGSTVTYRVPWSKRSYQARPMLSDAGIYCSWPAEPEELSTAQVVPAYFWRIADGNGDPTLLLGMFPYMNYFTRYQPDSQAGYVAGENNGARWYIDAEKKLPKGMDESKGFPDFYNDLGARSCVSAARHYLVMCGITAEKIPAQGIGYWSPLLATVPGAKITVSMRIRGKEIVSSDKGSPAIWLEFTNETGQHRQRTFVVGKDDAGKMNNAELTKGSFDWRDLKQEIVAPEGAIRMALFFGVLPCKGELDFVDINLKTASEAGTTARVILPPRLPLARIHEMIVVDLSNQANRALADEVENDGKGGWTDQGPAADMRELPTGRRSPGGLTYNIIPGPKSVVVLKSAARVAGDLPEKVTIPVGRKFDASFFFHSAA